MDGLKLLLEKAGEESIQNMFYNGQSHDHYVTNVFVFASDGTIRAMAINCPGTMHDNVVADWGGIYIKLEKSVGEIWHKVLH